LDVLDKTFSLELEQCTHSQVQSIALHHCKVQNGSKAAPYHYQSLVQQDDLCLISLLKVEYPPIKSEGFLDSIMEALSSQV